MVIIDFDEGPDIPLDVVSPEVCQDLFATISEVKRPALGRRLEQLIIHLAVIGHLDPCSVDVSLPIGYSSVYEHDLLFDDDGLPCVVNVLFALEVDAEAAKGRANVLDTRDIPPRLQTPIIFDELPLLRQGGFQSSVVFSTRPLALFHVLNFAVAAVDEELALGLVESFVDDGNVA